MSAIIYGPGGYRPQHPSKGKVEEHDDATATVTRWDDAGAVVESRPYTAGELSAAAALGVDQTRHNNRGTLSNHDVLVLQLAEIKTFLTDPDIEASLNRANNTAPTAQELNRTLKALIRQERRAANMVTRLARYVFAQEHPDLLDSTDGT